MINVGFSTPAPGSGVGRTFTVTGFTEDDGQADDQGHDQFALRQILVRFVPGSQLTLATISPDGTWSATGTLPAGTKHGDVIEATLTATVRASNSSGDRSDYHEVVDTLRLVAEQTSPQAVDDASDNGATDNERPASTPVPPVSLSSVSASATSADIVFTPTFRHTNWINNVDRIEAGGPNGFNVRYDAVDSDLRQMSTVVGQVNTALNSPGTPPGEQRLTLGVDLVSLQAPGQNGWFYDETGAAHPAGGTGGGIAMMGLSLPDGIRLKSFRAVGLYGGAPLVLSVRLSRVSLTDVGRSDVLAEVASGTSITNPYDITMPVDTEFALVDNSAFRYLVTANARLVGAQGSGPTTLSTVQLVYTAA